MTSKSVDKINDILAEIHFCLGCINHSEVDLELKKALATTHSLAWDIIQTTRTQEQ